MKHLILLGLITCIYPYDDLKVIYDSTGASEIKIYSYTKVCGIEIDEIDSDLESSDYYFEDN